MEGGEEETSGTSLRQDLAPFKPPPTSNKGTKKGLGAVPVWSPSKSPLPDPQSNGRDEMKSE